LREPCSKGQAHEKKDKEGKEESPRRQAKGENQGSENLKRNKKKRVESDYGKGRVS